MDYQPMGQPNPPMNQAPVPPPMSAPRIAPAEPHSNGLWYVIGAALIIAGVAWYFYGGQASTSNETPSAAVEQTAATGLTAGNTTADISTDLSQVPDTTADLNAAAAASAEAVAGF